MDSQKILEIFKNSIDEINALNLNWFILQWDNDSKDKSELSLDYSIHKRIQLFERPAYCPDLNPIENVWVNIKNKFGSQVYCIIEYLKDDIKTYWQIWGSHHNSIIYETMRRIKACIFLKENGQILRIILFTFFNSLISINESYYY